MALTTMLTTIIKALNAAVGIAKHNFRVFNQWHVSQAMVGARGQFETTIRTYLVYHVFCLQAHIFKFLIQVSNPIYAVPIHGDHNILQTIVNCPELSQLIRYVTQLSAKKQKKSFNIVSKLMILHNTLA